MTDDKMCVPVLLRHLSVCLQLKSKKNIF